MAVAELRKLGFYPREQGGETLKQGAARSEFQPQQGLLGVVADQAAPLIGPCSQAFERYALRRQIFCGELRGRRLRLSPPRFTRQLR